jgi:hypothetical protein
MKFGSTLLELRTLSSLHLLACRLACFHPWCWHVLSVLQSITRIDFENKKNTLLSLAVYNRTPASWLATPTDTPRLHGDWLTGLSDDSWNSSWFNESHYERWGHTHLDILAHQLRYITP